MSNIVLPEAGTNETIGEYIKRLVDTKVISASQIPLAIAKFNKK